MDLLTEVELNLRYQTTVNPIPESHTVSLFDSQALTKVQREIFQVMVIGNKWGPLCFLHKKKSEYPIYVM